MSTLAYVVAVQSDAMLARLALQSIRLQDRAPDLVVVVADGSQHALGRAALALPDARKIEYVSLAAASHGPATLGALYLEGLRTVARRVDVAIFCHEGLLFRPEHLRAVERDFDESADLVGLLETANDVVDIDVRSPSRDAAAILAGASARHGVRRLAGRWLTPRLASGHALCARTAVIGGLSFHPFSDRFDWIEFTQFIDRLKPRGRTLMASAASVVSLRRVSDRRSGSDAGRQAYRALAALVEDADGRALPARAEMIRLGVLHAMRMLHPAERSWSSSFLKGMWSARVAARTTRKAVARDLHDLV